MGDENHGPVTQGIVTVFDERALAWWIEHFSPGLEVRRYFPAEFMAQNTPRLDSRTLVFLADSLPYWRDLAIAALAIVVIVCLAVALPLLAILFGVEE